MGNGSLFFDPEIAGSHWSASVQADGVAINRLTQQAFIANPAQAEQLLAGQWPQVVVTLQTMELAAETLRGQQL